MCVLAVAPAIVLAAFAGRQRHRTLRTTLLILASMPCLIVAGFTVNLLNHHAPKGAGVTGAAVSGLGLALVALAAKFGRNLRTGWGLAGIITMALLPMVLITTAYLYSERRSRPADPQLRRHLPYPQQMVRNRQLAIEGHQRKANAEREVKQLRDCATELSIASGKADARRHHREGKIQFVIVGLTDQESMSEWFPGLEQEDYLKYGLERRSATGGVLTPRRAVTKSGPQIVEPRYQLWSDPWATRFPLVSRRDIQRCDAAIVEYASAYNRTMHGLAEH